MTRTPEHQRLLTKLADLHDAAVESNDEQLDEYRAKFRQRLRERNRARTSPATAGSVQVVSLRPRLFWLASGAAALLVLGIAGPRVVRRAKTVEVSPERASAATARKSEEPTIRPTVVPTRDPCIARVIAAGNEPLLDDFEDGNPLVAPLEQRVALWALFKDTDSSATFSALTPSLRAPATRKNRYALHAVGGELLNWGAVIQLSFQPSCYDVSAYSGISFSAKGPGRVYVGMREVSVVPVEFGGTCKTDCYNTHQRKVDLSARWQSYTVLWSEMRQRGYNSPPLDPKRVNGPSFLIHSGDTPYDLWIDDVKFVTH